MPTLADKMKADVTRVFLNPNHFAERVQYNSVIEGFKASVLVNKVEVEGGGQVSGQHSQTRTRRARFNLADTIVDGVGSPVENKDTITAIENSASIVWTLKKVINKDAGMWCLEFETYALAEQGAKGARSV